MCVSLYLGCVACTLLTPRRLKWQLENFVMCQIKINIRTLPNIPLDIWSGPNITHPCANQHPMKFHKLVRFLWGYRAVIAYPRAFSYNTSDFKTYQCYYILQGFFTIPKIASGGLSGGGGQKHCQSTIDIYRHWVPWLVQHLKFKAEASTSFEIVFNFDKSM